uniref:Uncharacterized protein n=1 Tax=Physcomitrium patens TaxID=3218 RepID=A0A2K1KBV3_PHYPA|nr:hypothetical protein PHYPA_010438 [Physcomitrium patens]
MRRCWNPSLVLDFDLHVVDGVRTLHVQSMSTVFLVNVVLTVCVLTNRAFGTSNPGNLHLDSSMDFVASHNVYKNNMISVHAQCRLYK